LSALVQKTSVAKGLKEPIEEDLRLALFIAGDVLPAPRGEFGEFFPARHGEVLHECHSGGNSEWISMSISARAARRNP